MDTLSAALVFLAGFIDSIAGGGGLITVPTLTVLLGPGAVAIGTNKILGFSAALTALIVYTRKGHLQIKGSMWFLVGLCTGTWLGAKIAMVLPAEYFRWFLLAACPVLLFINLKRDSFLTQVEQKKAASKWVLSLLGLACGIYDGAFGPGGGTFMFLSLVMFGGFDLLAALATSKLANTLSAGVSLVSFAVDGVVKWHVGLSLVGFIILGALIGSQLATVQAKRVVRPVLVIVVLLLMGRLIFL